MGLQLKSRWVVDPHETHSFLSVLSSIVYGIDLPHYHSAANLVVESTVLTFGPSLENSHLGPNLSSPPARFTSDQNGYGYS